ncbi:F-box domain protein [Aspergillus novofumigatus IBT 16806]|uniref:F-box domain protein n=1 Tax=Aspergillus novofumigatus (strain IBT 16806) TaxID=1392255 RepID=A0A2I1BXS4_ASPN1|nr:F-box domain protein [Aspergillus novofumigatus IBT 16806]PKX90183.1 F-box domain protein [Aspergillus novofumigatus IBT 16806]
MFSAGKLRSHPEPAFCMVCGLREGEDKWLKAMTNPRQDPWYRSLGSEIQNGTDVYLFHEQPCWDHLLEHFGPDKLHLASLFEALERLPLPRDYTFPSYASLPGRIGLCKWVGTKDDRHEFPILPGRFPLPSLEELMRFAKSPPKPLSIIAQRPVSHPIDGFGHLSFDILVIISSVLQTKEALDLRRVTRAAIPLFASSQFWRTRFAIDGERGFLRPIVRRFSPPEGDHGIDWRLLYHCTARLNCSDWFEIEIRAWETLRWLRDTASAIHHGRPPLQHYHNTTRRNTFIESVEITSSLCKIAISALQEAGEVNITGIEFIFDDGRPSAMLGYSTPGAQRMTRKKYARKQRRGPFDAHKQWPYPGVRVTMDVVGLRGIVYLKDANGIHGVAIYHGGEEFDDIDDTLHVGLEAHYQDEQEPVAYSVSLDKVEKVIAVVDNRKMIDLGISGTTTKRSEYVEDEWDDVVQWYKQDNAFLLKSM